MRYLEARHAIADAALILAKEQERRERSQHEEDEARSTMEKKTGREHWTPEEREHWDARADHEAWSLAHSVLEPWVRAAEPIGSDELTRVMKKALEEVENEVDRTLDRLEAAEAAIEANTATPAEAQPRRDPVAEALGRINSDLTSVSERLSEDVPVEAFADEEDYWRARRAIAKAGGLVVREEGRRRETR